MGMAPMSRVTPWSPKGADAPLDQHDLVVAPARTYSAAHSHSSIVAEGPRRRRTGFPDRPHRPQQLEILHVPRPDLEHVHPVGHRFDITWRRNLGHHREPHFLGGVASMSSPAIPSPAKPYVLPVTVPPRTTAPPPSATAGSLPHLIGILDRAGASDDGEGSRPNLTGPTATTVGGPDPFRSALRSMLRLLIVQVLGSGK